MAVQTDTILVCYWDRRRPDPPMQDARLSKFYITSFTEDHFISALISMRDYGFGFQAHLTDKHSLTEQANWVFV
jgi:hypothetical protein